MGGYAPGNAAFLFLTQVTALCTSEQPSSTSRISAFPVWSRGSQCGHVLSGEISDKLSRPFAWSGHVPGGNVRAPYRDIGGPITIPHDPCHFPPYGQDASSSGASA